MYEYDWDSSCGVSATNHIEDMTLTEKIWNAWKLQSISQHKSQYSGLAWDTYKCSDDAHTFNSY